MPEQYSLYLRFSMGCLLLGTAWFLTVANSDYGGTDTTRLRHLSSPKQLLRASHHDDR